MSADFSKATPRPWTISAGYIISDTGVVKIKSGRYDWALEGDPEADANAALIVAAVNSHDALVARVAAPEAAAAWQPIETAPKDGSAVIVAGDNFGDPKHGKHVRIGAWSEQGAWYDVTEDEDNGLAYLTHWMPLPAPPEPARAALAKDA